MSSLFYSYSKMQEIENNPGKHESEIIMELLKWGKEIGPCTACMIKRLWVSKLYETERFINSFLNLSSYFNEQRLEAACKRALFYDMTSFQIVKVILLQGLEHLALNHETDVYGQLKFF